MTYRKEQLEAARARWKAGTRGLGFFAHGFEVEDAEEDHVATVRDLATTHFIAFAPTDLAEAHAEIEECWRFLWDLADEGGLGEIRYVVRRFLQERSADDGLGGSTMPVRSVHDIGPGDWFLTLDKEWKQIRQVSESGKRNVKEWVVETVDGTAYMMTQIRRYAKDGDRREETR